MTRHALGSLALGLLLALAPGAQAKEESKLQILLLPPGMGGGNGNGLAKGQGPIGDLHFFLQDPGDLRKLQLRVRGLEPGHEHVLRAFLADDGSDTDPAELCRFTTGANGSWNGSCNIGKNGSVEEAIDPRGKYLTVSDVTGATDDVLAGWLYGVPDDDGPKTKVKELTRLAPQGDVLGSVDARYDMRPNRKGTFRVTMRGVAAGEYEVCVAGIPVGTLTPNAGGSAKATFRTHAKDDLEHGQPHNKSGKLDFDPRRKLVEIKLGAGGPVHFSGPMLAQIQGVNLCTEVIELSATPAGVTARLEDEPDCETALVIEATGLLADTYDVLVDGVDRGNLVVADDGMGGTTGALRFDPMPDELDELLLDFPVSDASTVELVDQP